jgi:hypothetical protein
MTKTLKDWYLEHERAILVTAVVVTATTAVFAQARVEAHRQFLRDVIVLTATK